MNEQTDTTETMNTGETPVPLSANTGGTPVPPHPARRSSSPEPELAVPGMPVVLACTLAPVAGGVVWAAIAGGLGYASGIITTGLLGAAIVLVVSLGALLVTSPWRRRPAGMQMTLWLAGMVIRLLVTPAGAFLLYSAAPLDGNALALSVGAIYLATLVTEAVVMSRLLGRAVVAG